MIRELEETPSVDLDKLAQALELLKMAKLAARPRQAGARASCKRPTSPRARSRICAPPA